jgi:hypothetical protein
VHESVGAIRKFPLLRTRVVPPSQSQLEMESLATKGRHSQLDPKFIRRAEPCVSS